MPFRSAPSTLLTIAADRVELWQRRRRKGMLIAALDPRLPDFEVHLAESLRRLKGHAIAVILNLPDLVLQTETLPRVSFLDRRKLRQSRFMLLSQPYDIAAFFPLHTEKMLFVAQPQNILLQTILQAITAAGCPATSLSHMALESFFLLPKPVCRQTGIAIFPFQHHYLILAHRDGHIVTCRYIPDDKTQLPQEIQRTFQYLQRHRWSVDTPIALTNFGTVLSHDNFSGLTISHIHNHPDRHPYMEILTRLASRAPRFPLTSATLRAKNLARRAEEVLTSAALLALAGSIILWAGFFAERQNLAHKIAVIQSAMQSLPPPLPITDRATIVGLDSDRAISLPAVTAIEAMISVMQSTQLTLPTEDHPQADWRFTTNQQTDEMQRHIHDYLTQIPGWQLQATGQQDVQGSLTDDTVGNSQIYSLKFPERDR